MIPILLQGLAHVANIVLQILTLLLIVSIGISWFNADPYNQYVRMVRSITEPMYRPFRRFTSRIEGPFDFAPMIVMLIVVFLTKTVPAYLMYLSIQLK